MNQPAGKYHHVIRYVYSMMAVLVVLALVAFAALYIIHSVDRNARERVTLYHSQSSALAHRLQRSSLLVAEQLNFRAAGLAKAGLPDPGESTTSRVLPGSEVHATVRTMSERVTQLQALESEYGDDQFAATLDRLALRLGRVERALTETLDPISTQKLLASLDLAIEQFYHQHDIAATETLEDIGAISRRALPSFGVIAFLLLLIGLTTWVTARQLRAALARQVAMESELAESQDRMHHMQKLEALGQLVGGIAHDFNNLLTAILGHAGLLLDKPVLDKDQKFGLSQIKQAGEQAATLTKQLLAFSRAEAMEPQVFSLNTIIQDNEDLLRRLTGENIEFVVDCADDLELVEMDPGQLQQVVLNLVVNARDAMPDGGRLTLLTGNAKGRELDDGDFDIAQVSDTGYVKLVVFDTGIGMDKETRDRIFEPYFTTKAKDRGTGLGLSTVHGIIAAAGGHIRVYSHSGSGSRFEIFLPRSEKTVQLPVAKATSKQQFYGTETVLIVEDEDQVRSFLKDGLGSMGYRVLTAADADAGLKICSRESGEIDVIVSDVVLPHTNGVEFLKDAKQLRPSAEGIFISGYTDDVLLSTRVESASTPLIYKPFELSALADLIRQRLDSGRA